MASQNIARLGVVLGIDTASWTADIDKAISENRKLANAIKRDNTAAEKEIERLTYAIKDYGKEVSMTEKVQREFMAGGKYENVLDTRKTKLLEQAKAYDTLAQSSKKSFKEQVDGLTNYQRTFLAYQSTDIVVSLAGGQNPIMVLLQQGGQLKDQFGGFGPMFRGLAQAISPALVGFTALAVSVGGLAFSAYKGDEEFKKLRDDLILTNNFAGITASGFNTLAASLSTKLNVSIGTSKEIFSALASSGTVARENLSSLAQVIANVSKLTGESATTIAGQLIPSFDGSTSSAKRLNEQYHFLNLAQFQQIEALNRANKTQEAARLTMDLFNESIKTQSRNLGTLETAWSAIKNKVSQYWDSLKSIGKDDTTLEALEKAKKRIDFLSTEDSGLSPYAKKRRQEELEKAQKEYVVLAQRLGKEEGEAQANAKQKAMDQKAISAYDKAGGAAKASQYNLEIEKLNADLLFQKNVFNATEFERIKLDSAKRIADKEAELNRRNIEEGGVFASKIQEEKRLFRIIEELSVKQKIQEINRQELKVVTDRQTADENSVAREKEKLMLYKNNLFITDSEYATALERLKVEQEIAKINLNTKLDVKEKIGLINKERGIQAQREEVTKLGESLSRLKEINNSVFNSMENAITSFVTTGKLNFKELVGSILMDLVRIETKVLATQALRSIFGSIGSFFAPQSGAMASNAEYGSAMPVFASAVGGPLASGQASIVGENGPELFVPRTSGTIVPNSGDLSQLQTGASVVYNGPYIASMSAIDTQSAMQFLSSNKMGVYAANQSASRSLPTSR